MTAYPRLHGAWFTMSTRALEALLPSLTEEERDLVHDELEQRDERLYPVEHPRGH